MTLLTHELKASYAFVERNFFLTRRYWGWELAFLVYSVAGALSGPFVVNRRAVFERPGEGPQPFRLRLAVKDLRLALDLAAELGAPMEQAALNRDVLERAVAAGFGDLDESAVAAYLRGGEAPGPSPRP